jgi:hypothetical protein
MSRLKLRSDRRSAARCGCAFEESGNCHLILAIADGTFGLEFG